MFRFLFLSSFLRVPFQPDKQRRIDGGSDLRLAHAGQLLSAFYLERYLLARVCATLVVQVVWQMEFTGLVLTLARLPLRAGAGDVRNGLVFEVR